MGMLSGIRQPREAVEGHLLLVRINDRLLEDYGWPPEVWSRALNSIGSCHVKINIGVLENIPGLKGFSHGA